MNENINLCEILKGLEGIELYSTVYGTVILHKVYPIDVYSIQLERKKGGLILYTKEGKHVKNLGECTLFPSKEQRDWSKFERPIPIGTPMICRNNDWDDWVIKYYKGINEERMHIVSNDGGVIVTTYLYIIPFDKFNPRDIEESLKYNIQK